MVWKQQNKKPIIQDHMKANSNFLLISFLPIIVSCTVFVSKEKNTLQEERFFITEVNSHEIPLGDKTIAIVEVSIIDGISESPIDNASVIVRDGIIVEIGMTGVLDIPEDAEIIEGKDMTLLPGLIDAHYHNSEGFPTIFLKRGITSLRDPGIWIEDYDGERYATAYLAKGLLCRPG